jgi:hypothetical protein
MTALLDAMVADSPTALWILGDSSGTTAADYMGNYNGAYNGGYTLGQNSLATFDTHTATYFNGTGYVSTTSHIVDGMTAITVEALVNIYSPTYVDTILSNFLSNQGIFFFTNNSNLFFRIYNGSGYVAGNTIDNSFSAGIHHVVGVYTGSTITVYLDTVAGGNVGSYSGSIGTGQNMYLGKYLSGSTYWYYGILQYCAIYNYALTPTQIAFHYACSRQRDVTQSGVVIYTPARTVLQSAVVQDTNQTRSVTESGVVLWTPTPRTITESVVTLYTPTRQVTQSGVTLASLNRSITESSVAQATAARNITESLTASSVNQSRSIIESSAVQSTAQRPVIQSGVLADVDQIRLISQSGAVLLPGTRSVSESATVLATSGRQIQESGVTFWSPARSISQGALGLFTGTRTLTESALAQYTGIRSITQSANLRYPSYSQDYTLTGPGGLATTLTGPGGKSATLGGA